MSELDDWIEEYRDGNLSDENRDALTQALKEDPEARRQFVRQMGLSAMLSERSVSIEPARPSSQTVLFQPQSPRRNVVAEGLLAAGLVIAFLLALRSPDSESVPLVAVVTAAENAVWEDGQTPGVGSGLGTGVWELVEGRIEVVLDNGAELFLDAPSRLEVESAFATTLHAGSLSARIPPSALGFRVYTPEVELIDLGTEFSVSVAENGRSAVKVHEGFVDARQLDGSKTMRLASRESASFGALSGNGGDPVFNALRPIDAAFPSLSGDIRALHAPPSSLEAEAFEHDYLLLFREQDGMKLESPLAVDMIQAGVSPRSARQFLEAGNALEAGEVIDSWMVHFDGVSQDDLICEAEIAFPNDILAVIATTRTLKATDPILGLEDQTYTDHNLRGVEFHAPQAYRVDEIVISGDRRLLKLRWHVSSQVDQIRIITRSPEKSL